MRGAPGIWAGVALVAAVAQTAFALLLQVAGMALRVSDAAATAPSERQAATSLGQAVFTAAFWTALVGVLVTMWVTGQAIRLRRGALALLALNGATPGQLVRLTVVQVTVIALAMAAPAGLIASSMAGRAAGYALDQIGEGRIGLVGPPPVSGWVWGSLIGLAVTALGGLLTARRLSRVAPVEALRRAVDPPARVGWARGAVFVVLVVAAFWAFMVVAAKPTGDVQGLVSLPLLGILLLLCAAAAGGPVLLPLVTRAWTALLPLPATTWTIARQQAATRINRSSATVVPLAVALAMPMAFLGMSGVLRSTMAGPGRSEVGPGVELGGLVIIFGPAVAIALAGALAGIVITSRARALDVALTSINGAGPVQTWMATALDGAIAMGTSLVVAAAAVATGEVAATLGLRRHFGHAAFSWPLKAWLVVGAAVVACGTVATLFAAVRPLLEPPFKVVSTYVAD
ncbi:MAG: ABC transporter permease [Bifidobacteriaceae bacterium]|jgi:putative ABC transport system permease protein|nr:ABC transporter permease [Bifidobacteriaceae bacterium]